MEPIQDNIVVGPNYNENITRQQFSKIIYNKLKEQADHIAFMDFIKKRNYTYEEILEKGIQLAIALKELGLQKNDTVTILLENHIFYWIITIACLFNGIVMHLLNPEFTKYELPHYLNITKCSTLFCSNTSYNLARWARDEFNFIQKLICVDECPDINVININAILSKINLTNEFSLETIDDNEQVAFILNSSGTTGLSKGVQLTHNNLKSMLVYFSHPDYFGFDATDRTVLYVPFYHIFGILIAINTMVFGMKSIILAKFQPEHFLAVIDQYKVTHLFLVPPIALFLTKSEMVHRYNLTSIKSVMCGAAPLGPEIEEQFVERFKIPIRQLYGMTELTGVVLIVPSNSINKRNATVGKIIPKSSAKIRDIATSAFVGPNKLGELCVKSDCIMKGYINNPEETANVVDDEGYLHTGDIGYYDNDGYFYIVDRLKEIIKYKAFQVAPAELEDIIMSHESVLDAAVIGIPDERAGETACAFVVKKGNCSLDENEIIKYVADRLSIHKHLHGGVIFVSEIPKSSSGKILRRQLKCNFLSGSF